MFFFIAGIQPKTVSLDNQPRPCPACGAIEARLFRVDHYFSAFFIPIFRVKKGATVLKCGACGRMFHGQEDFPTPPGHMIGQVCPSCGRRVDPSYRFCPHCGKRL